MSSTLAELVDRTLSGVGTTAPEICSISEAHNAVVQALNVRLSFARLSQTNSAASVTAEFFPNATSYDITTMIGGGVPVGCEVLEDARYVSVRAFGLDLLPENNLDMVGFGCAFETQTNEQTNESRTFVRFNVVPQQAVRIIYSSGAVLKALDSGSVLPENISELIVLEAQNILIPKIQLRYSTNLNRDENDRKDAQLIVGSFNGIFAANQQRIGMLEQLWRIWAFKSRQPNFGRRATPKSSRLYGD